MHVGLSHTSHDRSQLPDLLIHHELTDLRAQPLDLGLVFRVLIFAVGLERVTSATILVRGCAVGVSRKAILERAPGRRSRSLSTSRMIALRCAVQRSIACGSGEGLSAIRNLLIDDCNKRQHLLARRRDPRT